MKSTVRRLEKAQRAVRGLCEVTYKALRTDAPPAHMTQDAAFDAARRGLVKSITFPLSFDEEQAERRAGVAVLDTLADEIEGIRRDTAPRSMSGNLLYCTRPILYARQAPPRQTAGGYVGGNLITEDGEPFHQTQWKEMLEKRGCGFIVVTDYDESREPWSKPRDKQRPVKD